MDHPDLLDIKFSGLTRLALFRFEEKWPEVNLPVVSGSNLKEDSIWLSEIMRMEIGSIDKR